MEHEKYKPVAEESLLPQAFLKSQCFATEIILKSYKNYAIISLKSHKIMIKNILKSQI